MKQLNSFLLVLVLLVSTGFAYAQVEKNLDGFKQREKELKQKFEQYNASRDDGEREQIALDIKTGVAEMLSQPASFQFVFEELKVISVVKSKSNDLRLYTWVLPTLVGTYNYYGYLQTNPMKPVVHELVDKSDSIPLPDRKLLNADDWFGAVYYEMIEKKVNGTQTYTLLGWHGKNALITNKVIDVMFFDDRGRLKFGAPIFQLPNQVQRRVIFEYSAQATMSLKYHRVKKLLFLKQSMIVFDHLAPPDNSLLNQFQYYGPDFSNDAFKFKGGRWMYVSDLNVTNLDL